MKVVICNKTKFVLVLIFLLVGHFAPAQESPPAETTSNTQTSSPQMANLSDIIPLTSELSGSLTKLQNALQATQDIAMTEQAYKKHLANLRLYSNQFTQLKDSEDYRIVKLSQLRQKIEQETKDVEIISNSLKKQINQLEAWRNQWLADKEKWNQWNSSWQQNEMSAQLSSSFKKADETIDAALGLIHTKLETLLAEQEKVSNVFGELNTLVSELDDLITVKRFGAFQDTSPVMFSSEYFAQFKSDLKNMFLEDLHESLWSTGQYLQQNGWIIFLQIIVIVIVCTFLYRKREILDRPDRLKLLAMRPFSAGLFLVCMVMMFLNELHPTPYLWKLVNTGFCGIAFARLGTVLTQTPWKRHLIYGMTMLAITNRLLYVVAVSISVLRLYVVFVSLAILLACWKWAKENKKEENSKPVYTILLRLGAALFSIIIITELWGKHILASYLFISMLLTIEVTIVLSIFMHMVKGGVEWLFRSSLIRKTIIPDNDDIDRIINRTSRFANIAIWGLFILPLILLIWGVYENLNEAMFGFMTIGFKIGSQRLTVGLIIIAASIIYATFLLSWIIQKVFMDILFRKRKIEKGVRLSIERLIHYFILSVGFLIAISTLGFEITKITIMLSALGVGIGFGLQGVVNNFVSGLILLFERPVRIGDTIEIGDKWAEIKKIGLRSTRVQTYDDADLIIPNADLISNQVTNWTLSNRRVRLIIPVGVAYGSDVPLVLETLTECAKSSNMIAQYPAPQVLFLKFGESSLDFELRIWVKDADYRLTVLSQMHQEIDDRFRQANIVIAFPQRDLHICSMDPSIKLPSPDQPK